MCVLGTFDSVPAVLVIVEASATTGSEGLPREPQTVHVGECGARVHPLTTQYIMLQKVLLLITTIVCPIVICNDYSYLYYKQGTDDVARIGYFNEASSWVTIYTPPVTQFSTVSAPLFVRHYNKVFNVIITFKNYIVRLANVNTLPLERQYDEPPRLERQFTTTPNDGKKFRYPFFADFKSQATIEMEVD